jgi:hypothetical protein
MADLLLMDYEILWSNSFKVDSILCFVGSYLILVVSFNFTVFGHNFEKAEPYYIFKKNLHSERELIEDETKHISTDCTVGRFIINRKFYSFHYLPHPNLHLPHPSDLSSIRPAIVRF